MANILKDWVWRYKKQAPKYGYFDSIHYSLFNAIYFKRDGEWRRRTDETS